MSSTTVSRAPCIQPTYEELKLFPGQTQRVMFQGIQPTYEELKQNHPTTTAAANAGIQPTYEELKQQQLKQGAYIEPKVSSLPMRN